MRSLGQVVRRGNIWYIRFRYRGRHYRESSGSTRRSIAVALLRQRTSEAVEGRIIGPEADRVTFDDLVKLIETDYRNNARKSTRDMLGRVKHLRVAFGKHRAIDITHRILLAYVEKRRAAGAKPATIRYEIVVLGRAFTLAVQAGMLAIKPPLPTIKVRNTRTGFFEADEITRVLAALPEDLRPVIESVGGHVKPRDSDAPISAWFLPAHFFFCRHESASMSRV